MPSNYHPETYWSEVAEEIAVRKDGDLLAGDNEPYYAYKRRETLRAMDKTCAFQGKSVLEIGCGPGGNLQEVLKRGASQVTGVDISQQMVDIAKANLKHTDVNILKIDGERLPFEDKSFDLVFTVTVLQHNTDDRMMRSILAEACRVSGRELLICEKLDSTISGTDLCLARPVDYYARICAEHGFEFNKVNHINIRVSYYCSGAIRKLLNPRSRKEGEPITAFARFMQNITLPITRPLDKIFTSKKDVGCMFFERAG